MIHAILAFIICLLLTPVVRELSLLKRWVDNPNENRWHRKPTALMGGIAIHIAIVVPLAIHGSMQAILFPMGLMFVLGLFDDFKNIPPWIKLLIQSAIALLIIDTFRLYWLPLPYDVILSVIWIVGITNAFNLLDNMDGLATGTGIISSLILVALFLSSGNSLGLETSLILMMALAAFLLYNFKPASIFMGDCGSLMIGFILSVLCLIYTTEIKTFSLLPVWILIVPILDTTFVTINRIVHKRRVFIGGKDHLSHKLVRLGLNEKEAVLFLYIFGILVYLFMGK